MQYNVTYSCISHTGKIRYQNQDNYICNGCFIDASDHHSTSLISGTISSKQGALLGVFDGLGGHQCGNIASFIAARDAADLRLSNNPIPDLRDFCQKANTDICDYALNNNISSMGTTAALLDFSPKAIALCNIGDSKIFRFRNNILSQLSVDHSGIAPYGMKAPLYQYLGIHPSNMIIDPYFLEVPYCDRDCFLICSDGLTDMVQLCQIADVMQSSSVNQSVKKLLDIALLNGGTDNISIIVCRIERKNRFGF